MESVINIPEFTDQVYTVPQVAKIFKCNPNYVRDLIKSGALKALRLGEVKVSVFEIRDFLERYAGMDLSDPYDIKPFDFKESSKYKDRRKR